MYHILSTSCLAAPFVQTILLSLSCHLYVHELYIYGGVRDERKQTNVVFLGLL